MMHEPIESFKLPVSIANSITCIKYNSKGNLLFFGDNSGCINIKPSSSPQISSIQTNPVLNDDMPISLHSLNKLEIQRSSDTRALLLAAIDKSIDIWKIYPKLHSSSDLVLTGKQDVSLQGVHECIINSISMCANSNQFLSSDDLNVFLWDLNRNDEVCHIVDHKETVKPISEVITCAKFHPRFSYEMLWTSTNGSIRLGDLRTKFLMDKPTQVFKYESNTSWYYEELVVSISYAEFCKNHDSIIARDFFTVKYWDLRNTTAPYLIADVIENQNLSMSELYQSQAICAEFEVKDCLQSKYSITGAYGELVIINRESGKIYHEKIEGNHEILHIDIGEDGEAAYSSDNEIRTFKIKNNL